VNDAKRGSIDIRTDEDIVKVRQHIRGVCDELGFSLTDTTRIVTSASELARNVVTHATCGQLLWHWIEKGARLGLEIHVKDQGPGISDIGLAMNEGYSTGNGLGMGLPGTKRLMDDLEIRSTPGLGTEVVARKWLPHAQ